MRLILLRERQNGCISNMTHNVPKDVMPSSMLDVTVARLLTFRDLRRHIYRKRRTTKGRPPTGVRGTTSKAIFIRGIVCASVKVRTHGQRIPVRPIRIESGGMKKANYSADVSRPLTLLSST